MTYTIAIIDPYEGLAIREVDEISYELIRDTLGGMIEAVIVPEGMAAYCHGEGKLDGLARNQLATALYHTQDFVIPNDYIAGRLFLTGGIDDEGDDVQLSVAQVSFLVELEATVEFYKAALVEVIKDL